MNTNVTDDVNRNRKRVMKMYYVSLNHVFAKVLIVNNDLVHNYVLSYHHHLDEVTAHQDDMYRHSPVVHMKKHDRIYVLSMKDREVHYVELVHLPLSHEMDCLLTHRHSHQCHHHHSLDDAYLEDVI